MARNFNRVAMRRERPGQSSSKICRHDHRKDAGLTTREKVGRLSPVGGIWLEPVIWPNGNIEMLFVVSVEVSKQ